jgi:hypothetical protein
MSYLAGPVSFKRGIDNFKPLIKRLFLYFYGVCIESLASNAELKGEKT